MAKIFVLDNYDSFTYNLVHLLRKFSPKVTIKRNNEIKISEVENFSHIVISPGPGIPSEAGITKDLIAAYQSKKKILGVCLGHQAIAEVFGGKLEQMENVMHGKQSQITLTDNPIFQNLPKKIQVGRYHSWKVSQQNFPNTLKVIAQDENQEIMAIQHKQHSIHGLQFHPESILTKQGETILKNWFQQ